jgi:hypothetical protein
MRWRTRSSQITLVVVTILACNHVSHVSARRNAPPTSTSESTAEQLTNLGQASSGQVLGTASHMTDETVHEGQRQAGNLGKAAQIAGSPIVAGVSNEGAALLNVARVLGMPGLEGMLAGQMGVTEEPAKKFPNPDKAPESGTQTSGGGTKKTTEEPADMPSAPASTPAKDKPMSAGQAPQAAEAPTGAAAPEESDPAPAPETAAKQNDKGKHHHSHYLLHTALVLIKERHWPFESDPSFSLKRISRPSIRDLDLHASNKEHRTCNQCRLCMLSLSRGLNVNHPVVRGPRHILISLDISGTVLITCATRLL